MGRSIIAILMCIAPALFAADGAAPELTGIVLTNDRTVDTTSNAAIVKSVIHDGMSDQQKAYALWRFFIQRDMHKEIAPMQDYGNAAELMTTTAYALCGDWGRHFAALATDARLTASHVDLAGHVVCGIQYWGGWHTYDADMWALYTKSNGVVASPADIKDLKDEKGNFILRNGPPVKSYPWYEGPDSVEGTAAMYSAASVKEPYKQHEWRWKYDLHLRPGMEISWSWYGDPDVGFVSISHLPDVRSAKNHKSLREYLEDTFDYYQQKEGKPKWSWGNRRGGLPPNPLQSWPGVDGNGRLSFELGRERFKYALGMMNRSENIDVTNGKLTLADPDKAGSFVLNFAIPYPYGDAWINKPLDAAGLRAEISLDGKEYKEVYPTGGADDGQRIRLFDFVRGRSAFFLSVTLAPGTPPLDQFTAIGAFHHAFTALPGLMKGENNVSIRLNNPELLSAAPLHATYVFDQIADERRDFIGHDKDGNKIRAWGSKHTLNRQQRTVTFKPGALTVPVNMGEHWPLMREIRLRCGGDAPADPIAQKIPDADELDWGAAPWDWVYSGVNFWNDFERGDRQGWAGELTRRNTAHGSDFALDNSLLNKDGSRQLKIIRFGAFLNRDSKFRCELFVKNVKNLRLYTRNQGDSAYYEKSFSGFKNGEWQTFDAVMNDLTDPKSAKTLKNGDFLANIYLVVLPADGKTENDVEFLIDDAICYDGELKHDPFKDPLAPQKALEDDPIWNAKKP